MRYYLYKFSDNWADEMDIEGFAVMTEDEKDAALVKIKRQFKRGGTICFGSNEENEYDNLNDVLACISWNEISQSEYNTLRKLFGNTFGECGPLDNNDFEEEGVEYCAECGEEFSDPEESDLCEHCREEEEEKECIECGAQIYSDGDTLCDDCLYEQDYNKNANKIYEFIKQEYGIEATLTSGTHSKFLWKPTPKSEIEIVIGEYDDGEEEVVLTLKVNNRELRYEFFAVETIYDSPGHYLKNVIREFIEKAKQYQ